MRPSALGFGGRLALVAAAALAIRVLHAVAIAPASSGVEDAFWFSQVAHSLASGDGFTIFSGDVFGGEVDRRATAEHPPLYPLLLAAATEAGVSSDEGLRALGSLSGALTVVLIGLLGRRVGGDSVGLVAALIAAGYPLLIAADGALLSETIYAPLVAGMMLAALRVVERPSAGRAATLGAVVGLAVLSRSEATLFAPLLVLPAAWLARERRGLTVLVACACAALVAAPWVARNWARFDRPLLSTNLGGLLANTNCDAAYRGEQIGWLPRECARPARAGEGEAERDARLRREAIEYAGDHPGRLPAVVAVRVLRAWGLWEPFRSAEEQGRSANVMKLGIVLYFALLGLAIYGGATLMRGRRRELAVLLAPVAVATVTAATSYGSVRLRLPGDVALIVLGAVGAVRVSGPPSTRAARRAFGRRAPAGAGGSPG